MPVPPTTPASHHTCFYGIKENGSLSLDNTQICRDDQNLCVRITTDEGWEMRSCWDDDFNMEYSRPGCYKVREIGRVKIVVTVIIVRASITVITESVTMTP